MRKINKLFYFLLAFPLCMPVESNVPILDCWAEVINENTSDVIELSRNLWEINRITKPDEYNIEILEDYLSSPDAKIKNAAIRQLAIIDAKKSLGTLKGIDDYRVKPSVIAASAFLESSNISEITSRLDSVANSLAANPLLLDRVNDDIDFILNEKRLCNGPLARFCRSSTIGVQELSLKLNALSRGEKIDSIINTILEFSRPAEYEAAIAFGTDSIGNGLIPKILEELADSSRIPTSALPAYSRNHTIFILLLTVLKSIPDQSSIAILEEYSKYQSSFVAESAKEALEWVKSGVPYPYKYRRLLSRVDHN